MNIITFTIFILLHTAHANVVAHQGNGANRRLLLNFLAQFDWINTVSDWFTGAVDEVENTATDVGDWTVATANDVGEWTTGAANDVKDSTVNTANAVGDWTEGAVNDVADVANDIVSETEKVAEETGDWIKTAAEDIEDWASDAVECVVNFYEQSTDQCVLDAMKDAVDSCWNSNGKDCRFEIGLNDGQPCFGFAKKWSKSEVKTYTESVATENYEADAMVQISSEASLEASTHVEVGLTVTGNPQFDAKFAPPRVKLDANVQFEIEAGFSSTIEKRLELSEKSVVYSKIFMLAGVPVLVEATAQAVAIGVVEGSASAEGDISYSINGWIDFGKDLEIILDLSTGYVTDTNPSYELVRSFDDDWEYNFAGAADLSINANIGVELILTVGKLVAFTVFPSVEVSMEISAEFGEQQCNDNGLLSIEGSMEAKKSLELTAGLDESTTSRRRLGDKINLWNVLESNCQALNEKLGCGSTGGCSDVVGIFRDLDVWDGDIPIPADLSFKLFTIESPSLKVELDEVCLGTSQTSTASLTSKLSTAPCPNRYEMKGQARSGGAFCQDTCPSNCVKRHHILPDGSKQLQCGPICENYSCPKSQSEVSYKTISGEDCWTLQNEYDLCNLNNGEVLPETGTTTVTALKSICSVTCALARGEECPVSKWRVTAESEHNGGTKFQQDWWGANDSEFRVMQATDEQIEQWKDHARCSPLKWCKSTFNANGYFVESTSGKCIMVLNCHDAGYSKLAGTKIGTWVVSARSKHAGGSYFERVWEGPKTSKFRFVQATPENFEYLTQDSHCGTFISMCMNNFNLYGFYVQSSNGECVLPLNCHNAGFHSLAAIRHV